MQKHKPNSREKKNNNDNYQFYFTKRGSQSLTEI